MKLSNQKVSYARALDKLAHVTLQNNIDNIQETVLSLVTHDLQNTQKVTSEFGREVDFEINWMRKKLIELGIDTSDFQNDYNLTIAKNNSSKISFMPISWKQNQELMYRYSALQSVIEGNPTWWTKWKDAIDLDNDGIYFGGNKLTLDDMTDSDFTSLEEKFFSLENIPTLDYFAKLGKCIKEAGEEHTDEVLNFFGLKSGNYWTGSKGGYLHNGLAYFFNLKENTYSYTPVNNVFHVRSFFPKTR